MTAPSKPKVYDLAEIIATETKAHPPISFTAGGQTFTIPSPILWPGDIADLSQNDGAKVLLGDQWEAFCAAGGNGSLLNSLVNKVLGATVPE